MESSFPEVVTDDSGWRTSEDFFVGSEGSADYGLRVEHIEVSRRNASSGEALGLFAAGVRNVFSITPGNGIEGSIHSIPILEPRRCDQTFLVAGGRAGFHNRDEPVRIRIRQRFQ